MSRSMPSDVDDIIRDRTVVITGAGGLDRVGACPPGLRPRSAPALPGGPGGEPALPGPARAAGAGRPGPGLRGLLVHLANVVSRAAMDRLTPRKPRRHLPRGRVQARAHDGGPPHRGREVNVRRDDGAARRRGGCRRGAVRPRVDGQGGGPSSVMGATSGSGRCSSPRGPRTGRRTWRCASETCWARPAASCPIFQDQLERRAADDHGPGDDALLHDHPGGGPDPDAAALGCTGTCSSWTWASP